MEICGKSCLTNWKDLDVDIVTNGADQHFTFFSAVLLRHQNVLPRMVYSTGAILRIDCSDGCVYYSTNSG